MDRKKRASIPQLIKTRARLQQEINSLCPFCNNAEVAHFEIHHIDENPSNNDFTNLILLCRTCHSKISSGEIAVEIVKAKKRSLISTNSVQFISVEIDSDLCSWVPIENCVNAFIINSLSLSFPIFTFTFINHSAKTIILTNVQIQAKKMPVGLSGPYIPLPSILRPVIKYKIKLPENEQITNKILEEQIEIPSGRAFRFQVELFADSVQRFCPTTKCALQFDFGFNNEFYVKAPKILLNTSEEYYTLRHVGLA